MKPTYKVNKRVFDPKGFNLQTYLDRKLDKLIKEKIEEVYKTTKKEEK